MSRLAAIVLAMGVLAGCAGDDDPIQSSEIEPTREFDVAVPEVDTDWPIERDSDDTDSRSCRHPGGTYVADGFKFHMSGAWTLLVEVDGPAGPDATDFVYVMP